MSSTKRKPHRGNWVKGQSGNPSGRPYELIPGIRKIVDENKDALKLLILSYLNLSENDAAERQRNSDVPIVEKMLGQVIEKIILDGDVLKFRALLEIPLGKLPEEKDPLDLDTEETLMILTYRKQKEENARLALTGSETNSGSSPGSSPSTPGKDPLSVS